MMRMMRGVSNFSSVVSFQLRARASIVALARRKFVASFATTVRLSSVSLSDNFLNGCSDTRCFSGFCVRHLTQSQRFKKHSIYAATDSAALRVADSTRASAML
jgi:hypothetical protein